MSIYAPVKNPISLGTQSNTVQPQPTTLPEDNQIPGYVYRLTCIPTGQFYIGSRVGNITEKKMPKEDFWINYHTSSEYVTELRILYGKASFEYEIIYEDCDRDKVFWYEQEQIQKHYNDPLILNKQVNGYKDKHKGKSIPISTSGKHRKWEVTAPCGVVWVVSNLERYCKNNDLDPETMRGLARGKGKQYKGFKCRLQPKLPVPAWYVTIDMGDIIKPIEPIMILGKVPVIDININLVVPELHVIKFKHKEKTESLRSQYKKLTAAKPAKKPKPVIPYSPSVAKGLAKKKANGTLSSAAIKGQATQRKNGTHQNGNKATVLATRKVWEITDPAGNITITNDLTGFCKENGLSVACMRDVAFNRQLQHRGGWKCKECVGAKPAIHWEITDPFGNIITTDNIKQFCEDNSLSEPGMRKVALGSAKSHRGGWKCKRLD
jgi:hypothetical protein